MAIVVLALVVSTIAGALLAIWKLRVLSLLPASAFFVVSAILAGIVERSGLRNDRARSRWRDCCAATFVLGDCGFC